MTKHLAHNLERPDNCKAQSAHSTCFPFDSEVCYESVRSIATLTTRFCQDSTQPILSTNNLTMPFDINNTITFITDATLQDEVRDLLTPQQTTLDGHERAHENDNINHIIYKAYFNVCTA